MSKKICDALPITWIISFESESPNLTNIFVDRTFFIRQLHNSDMERVAKLKLVSQNKKYQTITFRKISDSTNSLPEFITFGKNLPSYKDDFKQLSDYCAGSSMRLRDILKKGNHAQDAHQKFGGGQPHKENKTGVTGVTGSGSLTLVSSDLFTAMSGPRWIELA